jgi:hypothetical protein
MHHGAIRTNLLVVHQSCGNMYGRILLAGIALRARPASQTTLPVGRSWCVSSSRPGSCAIRAISVVLQRPSPFDCQRADSQRALAGLPARAPIMDNSIHSYRPAVKRRIRTAAAGGVPASLPIGVPQAQDGRDIRSSPLAAGTARIGELFGAPGHTFQGTRAFNVSTKIGIGVACAAIKSASACGQESRSRPRGRDAGRKAMPVVVY